MSIGYRVVQGCRVTLLSQLLIDQSTEVPPLPSSPRTLKHHLRKFNSLIQVFSLLLLLKSSKIILNLLAACLRNTCSSLLSSLTHDNEVTLGRWVSSSSLLPPFG